MNTTKDTNKEFDEVMRECRELFVKKLADYGCSWRVLRTSSVTDQIFIKAMRIRTLESGEENMVGEGIRSELIGIINYSIIGLIQLRLGAATDIDVEPEKAVALYDEFVEKTKALLRRKNHDYGEAWRLMRTESYTDLILTKIIRTKQIEDNQGKTLVSEGIDANYYDMLNYAAFGLIRDNESRA